MGHRDFVRRGGRSLAGVAVVTSVGLACLSAAYAGHRPVATHGEQVAQSPDDWSWLGGSGDAAIGRDRNPGVILVTNRPPPATHIETELGATGMLVRTSYTETGVVSGAGGRTVRVLAIEAAGASTARGIALEVRGAQSKAVVYVDGDGIEALQVACRDLARAGRPEGGFQAGVAHVRFSGGLSLVNRDVNGTRVVLVSASQVLDSGVLVSAACSLDLNTFSQFTQQIDAARRVLGTPRQ